MLLHGKCHCGNVALELDWAGDSRAIPARACRCTFCTKHGAVWTAHPGSRLVARIAEPERVSRYAFGTKTATFFVCARCGAVPLVTSEIDGRLHAVVNVNVLEGLDSGALVRGEVDFDGEATDARLARRSRHWIGDVRVELGRGRG